MSANKKLKQMVWAAIFAAAITVTTAYLLHIPLPTGGYVHVGDALIYLAVFLPQFLGTLVQAVGSGVIFVVLAYAFDKVGLKQRLRFN